MRSWRWSRTGASATRSSSPISTVLWLVGSAGIRAFWPAEFGALEGGQPITAVVPLLLSVALSLACSLAAGVTVATAAPRAVPRGLTVVAVLLVATGVGVQASVWTLMPAWYHLVFFGLLVPGCLLGARLKGTGSLTPTAG